jgi:hypothetical protein
MIPNSLVVAGIGLATLTEAAGSTCPLNYPAEVNNTKSHNGLVLTIASNNASTNNRALQLRPNPFLEGSFFVGVDASSPVLLANFREAGFYSQARDIFNQLYDLGPTGYLNLRDDTNGTQHWTVGFANATQWPGEVERAWYLAGGSEDGTYGLYHKEDLGVVHGFILCEPEVDLDNGPWLQLFYQTYTEFPTDTLKCESIGLRTTVAATIYNGACDIGGYVAT